jgi:hypothetical protein
VKRLAFIVLWFGIGATACGVSEESKRAEVASVTVAIDRLRDAPNAGKAEQLTLLRKTPCTLPDVCQLRDACAAAYGKQVEALAQITQLKEQGTAASDMAARFLAVQEQLARARDEAKACVDGEARLLERYRAKSTQ